MKKTMTKADKNMEKEETLMTEEIAVEEMDMTGLFTSVTASIKAVGLRKTEQDKATEIAAIADVLGLDKEESLMLPLLFEVKNMREMTKDFKVGRTDLLYYIGALNRLSYDGLIAFDSENLAWSVPSDTVIKVLRGTSGKLTDFSHLTAEELAGMVDACLPHRMMPVPENERRERTQNLLDHMMATGHPLVDEMMEEVKGENELENHFYMTLLLLIVDNAALHGNIVSEGILMSKVRALNKRFPSEYGDNCRQFLAKAVGKGMLEELPGGEEDEEDMYYRVSKAYAQKHDLVIANVLNLEDIRPGNFARPMGPTRGRSDKEDETPAGFNLIEHTGICAQQLFYNQGEREQVGRIERLLDKDKLAHVQSKLADMGRTGMVCLFYGAPGTGKTETCKQLARLSGRDLCSVDISQIKDRWMGNSEKFMRGMFRQYDEAVAKAKAEDKPFPILLLNEADSIISRRVAVDSGSDQVMNSLQDILLDEFEKTGGFIICTTNLTDNMDDAFERRFLYKIEFNRPGAEARTQIWKSKLPCLTDAEAEKMGADYDFSGGEIENITRKAQIDNVLDDIDITLERITLLANEERYKKEDTRKKVGFVA